MIDAHLHPVAAVDMELALVIFPSNTELDDALGDLHDVECALVLGVGLDEGLDGLSELIERLK